MTFYRCPHPIVNAHWGYFISPRSLGASSSRLITSGRTPIDNHSVLNSRRGHGRTQPVGWETGCDTLTCISAGVNIDDHWYTGQQLYMNLAFTLWLKS